MRDAIKATQGFSLAYLWIDCLCIQQDGPGSEADWEAHLREMRNIYQNCIVNITAAASLNPNEPLFRRRNSSDIRLASFELRSACGDGERRWFTLRQNSRLEYDFEGRGRSLRDSKSPLSARGWVLQERMMSPRCVDFGASQVFWECSETTACEAFPQGSESSHFSRPFDIIPRILDGAREGGRWPWWHNMAILDEHRYDIIEEYARRLLSMPAKDKLVAIASIMETLNTTPGSTPDDYICGYFRRDLPLRLYWSTYHHQYAVSAINSPGYRAPSWSWAATDQAVDFCAPTLSPFVHTYLEDAHWTLVDERNPYGRVRSARLVLRTGLLTIAGPVPEDYTTATSSQHMNDLEHKFCSMFTGEGELYNVHIHLDHEGSYHYYRNFIFSSPWALFPIHLLPIGCSDGREPSGSSSEGFELRSGSLVNGLVIAMLDEAKFGPDVYVRIGIFEARPEDAMRKEELRVDNWWAEAFWSCLEPKTLNLL